MALRRRRLPVLANLSGLLQEDGSVWSLRRSDFERLRGLEDDLGRHRAILVTGTDEGPRAATVALALAATASAAGIRSALVECDLTRPRLAAALGLSSAPGLHEYLRWEATPADVLQPVALAGSAAGGRAQNLACIVAGEAAPSAVTLLGLGSFHHMATKLRTAYELVVFAAPPLGRTSGLDAIAGEVEATIAALAPAAALGRANRGVREALAALPAPALGGVVLG